MESAESIIILNKKRQEELKEISLNDIFEKLKDKNINGLKNKIKEAVFEALQNKHTTK